MHLLCSTICPCPWSPALPRYVSQHTVAYWASSFIGDLQRVTRNHVAMRCYGLGLGLDTFRMVALDANFRKLEESVVTSSYTT